VTAEIFGEILEYIAGEFMALFKLLGWLSDDLSLSILQEIVGDKIGDIIQSIIGSVFIAFVVLWGLIVVKRPAPYLWVFKSFANKLFGLILVVVYGLCTFIGVFNKKFSSGADVFLGALIWPWLSFAVMFVMRYLDMLVEVPKAAKKYYPTKRDVNVTWIYLIGSSLVMHFTFYFLSFVKMLTYLSAWIGLFILITIYVGIFIVMIKVKPNLIKECRSNEESTENKIEMVELNAMHNQINEQFEDFVTAF